MTTQAPAGPAPTAIYDGSLFNGATVLITGGSGSFGQLMVQRLLSYSKARKVIIFSRDEFKQYEMQQRIPAEWGSRLRFFIGDVRDRERLELAMRKVDICIHAAALKHVPAAEYNPFECIHTNVLGAENVVRAALRTGVRRVLALSSDKAANPVNLYGASKLASDKIFIAANHLSGPEETRFAVVRYGNVVGSRGSVIPYFRQLIAKGIDHLPITDPRMTRFWITLPQGADFVASSLTMMRGGEIFIPKIPSMRIVDMAHALAPDLPQRVVGIRPGEKLHEVMITVDDARNALELSDRYVIEPAYSIWGHTPVPWPDARPLPDGFSYASDTNTQWLSEADLQSYISLA